MAKFLLLLDDPEYVTDMIDTADMEDKEQEAITQKLYHYYTYEPMMMVVEGKHERFRDNVLTVTDELELFEGKDGTLYYFIQAMDRDEILHQLGKTMTVLK